MPEFYTWTILLINQLGEIGEKLLSVMLQRGPNLPLNARTPFNTKGASVVPISAYDLPTFQLSFKSLNTKHRYKPEASHIY